MVTDKTRTTQEEILRILEESRKQSRERVSQRRQRVNEVIKRSGRIQERLRQAAAG